MNNFEMDIHNGVLFQNYTVAMHRRSLKWSLYPFMFSHHIAEVSETAMGSASQSVTPKSRKRSKNAACETSEKPKSNKRTKKCELYMQYVASDEFSTNLLQGDTKSKANVLQISTEREETTTSKGN